MFTTILICLIAGSLAQFSFGQTPSESQSTGGQGANSPETDAQPRPFRPDVSVVIRKHSTGADLVEVGLLNPAYRPTEFVKRLQTLGKLLNSDPRGLSLFAQDLTPAGAKAGSPKLLFAKATFAVNGLLNGPDGIRLQPIAQAFAGGQGAEQVNAIEVVISGETGTSTTVHKFSSPAVEVVGQSVTRPPMLDYRIWLLSQNADSIQIPDTATQQPPAPAPIHEKAGMNPFLLWGAIVLIGAAVAVLVYNLSLRGGPPGSKRTGARHQSVHRVP